MSLKDALDRASHLADDLLAKITNAFPDAAGIVNSPEYDLAGKTAQAKKAILATEAVMTNAAISAGMGTAPWPFPTSTSEGWPPADVEPNAPTATVPADEFQLFRHVRDGKVDELGRTLIAPTGGLTFFVDVKHNPEPEIKFAICVQEQGKNFKYRLGRDVSKGRFEHEQHISGPYDLSKSLLQNIQDILNAVVLLGQKIPEVKTQLQDAKIEFEMLCMAANMLAEYTVSLPRQQPGDPK